MQRPVSVTIFGILNLVFAALGVLGLIASFALLFQMDFHNPVVRLIHENPGYAAWLKVSVPIGLVACLVLLAAGIGLLLLKSWARILSIGYAIFALLFGGAGVIANFVFLVVPLLQQAQQQSGPEAVGAVGGAIGSAVGGCFGLLYPILLLIFMTRSKVVAAFQSSRIPTGQ